MMRQVKRLKGLGLVRLEKSKSLMAGSKKIETNFPGTGPRESRQKPKYRKVQLNLRKNTFLLFRHWSRLPEEVVESPSLETFKSPWAVCFSSPFAEPGRWTR